MKLHKWNQMVFAMGIGFVLGACAPVVRSVTKSEQSLNQQSKNNSVPSGLPSEPAGDIQVVEAREWAATQNDQSIEVDDSIVASAMEGLKHDDGVVIEIDAALDKKIRVISVAGGVN